MVVAGVGSTEVENVYRRDVMGLELKVTCYSTSNISVEFVLVLPMVGKSGTCMA